MVKLFVSYRRSDSDVTGRICDHLQDTFGEQSIFKDVDSLLAGHDFRRQLQEAVNACDVMLAVMGPNWTSLNDERGNRRLDDEADFVRIEIEAALERDIRVIPLLIHNAMMPRADELPETLRDLAFRHGLAIHRDPDFRDSVRRLIRQIEGSLEPGHKGSQTAHATTSTPDNPTSPSEDDSPKQCDSTAWNEYHKTDALEKQPLTATIIHMHQSTGTLADLILPVDFSDVTERVGVSFTDPTQPNSELQHVMLDVSCRPGDPVRYLRLPGLRLGNEWWSESHPVLLRVYRAERIASRAPAACVTILHQNATGLVTGESLGYMKKGEFRGIIDPGVRTPCVVTRRIKTTRPGQTRIQIQTATESKNGTRLLGATLVAPVLPAPPGEAWVDCEFRVDQDGRATLKADGPLAREPSVAVYGLRLETDPPEQK